MRDRVFENISFPESFDVLSVRAPLVLAPHPDDEVIGCGGFLALLSRHGVVPRVVVLTDGQAQHGCLERDVSSDTDRRSESLAAARLLGYEVEFWGLSDRDLRCSEELRARLGQAIASTGADLVLCPALHEPHPDHQATALALLWCMGRLLKPVDLCFYESGATLVHCTHLVDISAVHDRKAQALDLFVSQESVQPYRSRIMARDHFRAMTLGPEATAAEGFQWLPLGTQGWSAVLPALDPLFLHARQQAVSPCDLPLISVVIRTMGDPRLEYAVGSVLAQSHPTIELILVVASGTLEPPVFLQRPLPIPVRLITPDILLSRSRAANAGLEAATGDYCLFLDDDDLIAPDHLEKLLAALRQHPQSMAAHTDVQVINAQGAELMRYQQPFSRPRICFANTMPIHSVLFSRVLVSQHGCRFDEGLEVLEDWDFWLQVCEHTDIVHVSGISAVYRYADRSRLNSDSQSPTLFATAHQRVCLKWLKIWPSERVATAMFWHASQLDQYERLLDAKAQRPSAGGIDSTTSFEGIQQLGCGLSGAGHAPPQHSSGVEDQGAARLGASRFNRLVNRRFIRDLIPVERLRSLSLRVRASLARALSGGV